jgi:hypothetical protein
VAVKKDNGKTSADTLNQARVASTAKKRAAKKLPLLSLSAALEWRRAKKESEKFFKKILKREVPELPGDWLFGRVGKRDHVRPGSIIFSPLWQAAVDDTSCPFPPR